MKLRIDLLPQLRNHAATREVAELRSCGKAPNVCACGRARGSAQIRYRRCAQPRNRATTRAAAWLRSCARARTRNSLVFSLKEREKMNEAYRRFVDAMLIRVSNALGLTVDEPGDPHPPLGPSAAEPRAGNSTPARPLAAGPGESERPVKRGPPK